MADTGWHSPGTMASDAASGGTRPWAAPDNAKANDGSYSTSAGAVPGGWSYYLKATNFSMGVPAGATINGIKVQFEEKRGATAPVTDWKIYIIKATGVLGGLNKSAGWAWVVAEAYVEFGGAADLWGEAWTAANINDVDFGVVLAIGLGPLTVGYVDHIRIKVYYTEAVGTNIEINIGDVFKNVDEISINIGDVWKTVEEVWINIGDVWKQVF